MSAEAAERDADRALIAARRAVKEAREHIKRLEKEAAEEARLAKIKQEQASKMSKRGHMLGRKFHNPRLMISILTHAQVMNITELRCNPSDDALRP